MVTAETHAPIPTQCSVKVNKVNFEKKNPVLLIEKFPFLVLARDTMLQHLIIHFWLQHLLSGRLQEVKTKED